MANKQGWTVVKQNVGPYDGTGVQKGDKKAVLLNPSKKAEKYVDELKKGEHYTNWGAKKKDEKGYALPLTSAQRSYRAGYLAARDDSAGAYLSNQAKTDPRFVSKLEARKERKRNLSKSGASNSNSSQRKTKKY